MKRSRIWLGIACGVIGAASIALYRGFDDSGGDDGNLQRPVAASPFQLSESSGSYRGVEIGNTENEIEETLGRAVRGDTVFPLDERPGARLIAPPATGAPAECQTATKNSVEHLRYRRVSFVTCNKQVFEIFVTDTRAETTAGVGIGDELDEASEAYSDMDCVETAYGDFGEPLKYCSGKPDRYYIYFGGDPIGSIIVATVPLPRRR
jgi:hypothetical protein